MQDAEVLVRCPVCGVADQAGPACRRCKADLTLLLQLERGRGTRMARAWRLLRQGCLDESIQAASEVLSLRHGADAIRLIAIAHLLRGDPEAAWRAYCNVLPPAQPIVR